MKEEFVGYTQALALKELGFDEPCFRHYKNNGTFTVIGRSATRIRGTQIIPKSMTGAPLYQQAFRWLFEKRGIKGCMIMDDTLDAVLNENIKLLKKKNEQSK